MKTRAKARARDALLMIRARPWYDHGKGADHTNIVDALSNLLHYCTQKGIDFDGALLTAREHERVERGLDARNALEGEAW